MGALRVLVSSVAAAVLAAGCEGDGGGPARATEAANGGAVTLAVGQALDIDLAGNPSTGYQWQLASADDPRLPLQASFFVAQSGSAGSGGTYRFRFRAAAAGTVALRLEYRRPWESAVAQLYTLSVTIR